MGRELRRKQAKKEGKSLKKEIPNEGNQVKSLIIITITLVIIVGLIYLISALFITKELDWFDNNDDDKQTETLATNTILASKTFDQTEEEYYVYFYDYDDEDDNISAVVSSLTDLTVYRVDTGSTLNKNYVSDESNKSAKSLEDLKVKASTIIKVSGETIVAYYEDDEITTNLG